ncbi:alpha/beta fold hydrolase [Faecalicoccus pleomorphus]|uniref:alpha/beta fold hydrolase n=1 Tax=Faecalicoccus pleomorphus TaxID=1323 RepID=UPI0039F59BD0
MKIILIHGTGHKADSWNQTIRLMDEKLNIVCLDLNALLDDQETTYTNLYSAFSNYCLRFEDSLCICGLSLGGVLALDFALEYPDHVKKLVLIGTPHKVPKILFRVQNLVFHFLPKSVFKEMAFDKKETLALTKSMIDLNFENRIHDFSIPTMLICGDQDKANIKSSQYFNDHMMNAKLTIFSNTGHIVNEEKPQELAKLLNDFFVD